MEGERVLENATLIIAGDTIQAISPSLLTPPPGETLIDLRSFTVLPGLIDCHVHLEWEWSKNTYQEKFVLNPPDIAFRAIGYARRTLEAGFTTVRDLGGTGVNISLRNAVNEGLLPGPRILTAGRALSITGGHGDPTNGGHWDLFAPPGPELGVADGPDDCRAAVRTQIKHGADCIKVCATGGVLSLARDGRLPHYSGDELSVVVQTARDLGVDVAAHAHGDEGILRAVRAGVRSIEHGTFMEEPTMDSMLAHGVWYIPTLTAGWAVSDSAMYAQGFYPEMVRTKALGIGPQIQATLGKVYRKGVPIAFGSDAGVFPHGLNGLEFGFMADAGMREWDILRAATLDAARMLRIDDRLGSLRSGKLADLIAVEGDPLQDIHQVMRSPVFVMKGGVAYFQK